jgi:hypothetical protein
MTSAENHTRQFNHVMEDRDESEMPNYQTKIFTVQAKGRSPTRSLELTYGPTSSTLTKL